MRHPESTSGDAWVEGRHKELSRVNYIWLWTGSLRVCIHCQAPWSSLMCIAQLKGS